MSPETAPRRALILDPAGNLFGSERVLLDFLGAASVDSRWQLAVCCPPSTPLIAKLNELPVKIFATFIAGLHRRGKRARLRAALGLLVAAARFRPHLIYVNQAGATRIALLVARLLRIPVVTHVRLVEDVAYVSSLTASPRALPIAVCISAYIRGLFDATSSFGDARLVTLYDPYRPQRDWNRPAKEANSAPSFVCVGRIARTKGQDLLLAALSSLHRGGIDARARFIGTPAPGETFDGELRRLVTELDLTERVTWAGFSDDVLTELEAAAALVVPSRREPLGRVVFEAWDAGVVPIGFAGSGGCAELISASGGGLLFERADGDSLAETLTGFLALSASERSALVARGRAWARANCDPARFAQQLLRIWEDVS